ncbi:hypothetical protein GOP47_0024688 [Adiantum capillus-veneris]|uniref:Uncharacterized protein n=1 Tax=Adiantum capillus-veneris TaxID=13818 RepID=A0A9D4U2J9_ADICA|nr:hypothetical protein GOP47_0024688 [Adiantum capillus-veneris]
MILDGMFFAGEESKASQDVNPPSPLDADTRLALLPLLLPLLSSSSLLRGFRSGVDILRCWTAAMIPQGLGDIRTVLNSAF